MPVFMGTSGNDTLTGGPGPDTLIGLAGDDSYFVDDPGDEVVEAAGEGFDIIYVSPNFNGPMMRYVLAAGAHVEVLGTSNNLQVAEIGLTGNELDNYITGNAGRNDLNGGGGSDVLWGRGGNDYYWVGTDDIVIEYAGDGDFDVCLVEVDYQLPPNVEVLVAADGIGTAQLGLYGNELDNTIQGNFGNNTLDGGAGDDVLEGLAGADRMLGRTGNDIFYVDNVADTVEEAAGEGNDTVIARLSYALTAGASIEILRPEFEFVTDGGLTLIGNELANTIYGTDGSNLLDGGGGSDTLVGRRGNDSYYVQAGDIIIETGNNGADIAYARGDYTLNAGADVEILATIDNFATTPIHLTGNELSNYLIGNAGANVFDGGGANAEDMFWGREGDDIYYVDGGDIIIENPGDGNDTAYAKGSYHLNADAHVEVVAAANSASTTASLLSGNEFANTVIGSAGANTINGRGGADTLQGLGGADTFAFTTALGSGNVDQIVDFVSGTDKIALENKVFTGLSEGALPAGAFVTGTAAQDSNDRIIYDNTTGQIYFDADGNGSGAAILFATIGAGTALVSTDFTVI